MIGGFDAWILPKLADSDRKGLDRPTFSIKRTLTETLRHTRAKLSKGPSYPLRLENILAIVETLKQLYHVVPVQEGLEKNHLFDPGSFAELVSTKNL
jgi:hypothetical protein